MADFDIEQLTPEQQQALQQYTDVTNQDVADAVPVLQRSQWNAHVRHGPLLCILPGFFYLGR